MKALDTVLTEHGSKKWNELIDYTLTLDEWIAKDIRGNRTWAIPWTSEMAEGVGYSKEQARAIEAFERNTLQPI